jgi:hypothetical protein
VFSLEEQISSYKKVTKKIPVTSKPLLKKKCIVKVKKRKIRGTSESELKLRNSNTGRRKDCKKKTNMVCPQRRKKERKKVILIRKIIKREACPQPEGFRGPRGFKGPQGATEPAGPQGEQGPPGPLPDITIIPMVNRYYYITSSDLVVSGPVAISANLFTDDAGNLITNFSGLGPNSYNNLFINGILQEGNAYSVSPNTLTLNLQGNTVYSGTPITLETIQFFALVS